MIVSQKTDPEADARTAAQLKDMVAKGTMGVMPPFGAGRPGRRVQTLEDGQTVATPDDSQQITTREG